MARSEIEPARELGDWLVDQHRADQEQVGRDLVGNLAPLWKIIEPTAVDSSAVVWVDAAVSVVEDSFVESQQVADRFVRDYRQAMVPAAEPMVEVEFDDFPADRARVSVIVTGPVEVKRQSPSPDALEKGFVGSSGAAVRIAGEGGRKAVERLVEMDEEAIGYARKTDSKPCYFCAMLASRGAVYKDNSFELSDSRFEGEGVSKVHDNCQCTLRPVYDADDDLDEEGEEFWRIWEESTEGLSGAEERKAFRRAYENRDRPEPKAPADVPVTTLERVRADLLNEGFAEDSFQVVFYDRQIERFGGSRRDIAAEGEPEIAINPPRPDLPRVTSETIDRTRRSQLQDLEAELAAAAERQNLNPEVMIDRANEGLRTFAEGKQVAINLREEAFLSFLDDGRYKTQYETGAGSALYDPVLRANYEQAWFGEGSDVPTYGYLRSPDGKSSGADAYGPIALVLHDAVKDSITVTVGDSMGRSDRTIPGALDDLGRHTAAPVMTSMFSSVTEYADHLEIIHYATNYVEAQIHRAVTPADVAEVVFRETPTAELLAALSARGLQYSVRAVKALKRRRGLFS